MATEILPGVTSHFFPIAAVNAFVVEADVRTLIDTGTPGGADRFPDGIERIILTHRHADHAGNAAELAQRTGAVVHVSPGDAPFVIERREQPRPRAATPLGRIMVPYVDRALPWTLEPVAAAQTTLSDGATIGPFRVIATPGHTAGHVSLLWEERGILFAGDAAANLTRLGPHPAADDPDEAQRSFQKLAGLNFEAACFGHGRPLLSAAARFRAAH
jgi:glyoxylase-like metal-dependent hydrolase (beta-lactamase superfamily II)